MNDAQKWVELARLRQKVQALEDDLGLENPTFEPGTGQFDLDMAIQALVAEHATDIISVHAPNADIQFITPSVTRNLGYRDDKLIGRNAYDLVHPDDIDEVAGHHARLVDGPQTIEYRVRAADGDWRWVETRAQALIVGAQMSRMVWITRDVHQRRLAQAALERSNADLRHFALVAAHDLHEPLRIVASFAELLGKRYRDALDARGQGYLDFIVDNVTRMRGLIDGLLQFTRIEVQRPDFDAIDVGEVVSTVLTDLGSALDGAHVDVGALPRVRADRIQLAQLFRELVGNAIKFRRPEVRLEIHIGAERSADGWLLRVADNGQGFPVDDADRVFDMFERLVGLDVPGSGIGLAAAKRITERHDGAIWAEPMPGAGTTVFVRLPADGDTLPAVRPIQGARDESDTDPAG